MDRGDGVGPVPNRFVTPSSRTTGGSYAWHAYILRSTLDQRHETPGIGGLARTGEHLVERAEVVEPGEVDLVEQPDVLGVLRARDAASWRSDRR